MLNFTIFIIIYLLGVIFVAHKQSHVMKKEEESLATLLGFIWPITLLVYIFRSVFINKWK